MEKDLKKGIGLLEKNEKNLKFWHGKLQSVGRKSNVEQDIKE